MYSLIAVSSMALMQARRVVAIAEICCSSISSLLGSEVGFARQISRQAPMTTLPRYAIDSGGSSRERASTAVFRDTIVLDGRMDDRAFMIRAKRRLVMTSSRDIGAGLPLRENRVALRFLVA